MLIGNDVQAVIQKSEDTELNINLYSRWEVNVKDVDGKNT